MDDLLDELEHNLSLDGRDGVIVHEGIRRLIAALVVRGLRDLNTSAPHVRDPAISWWFPKRRAERKWVFSSYHCCHLLGLDYSAMQDFILHNWPCAKRYAGRGPRTVSAKWYNFVKEDHRGRR